MRPIYTILLAAFTATACGGGGGGGNSSPPPPPTNNAPSATDVAALTRPGTAVSGTLTATDADGDSLTFAVASGPANGSVSLSGTGNQDFEYTPNGGFAGVDTFTFNASDGSASSNTATATITVNTPPSVAAASYTTSDIGTVTGVISASDADGDSVTVAVSTAPSKGTITDLDAATGAFTYTPDPAQDGPDSFAVTASDAAESSTPAVIDIEIFDWVGTQQLGSSEDDALLTYGLIINDDGSQLQAGSTAGQVGLAPPAGLQDIFLRSTDRRGNETSIAQFGGADNDVPRVLAPRPQGDGYYLVARSPDDNIYRFDDTGALVFSAPLPNPGGLSFVATVYWGAVDEDGNVYVLSWIDPVDPNALTSGLVTKVNGADGTLIWQRELPTSIEDPANFFIADTDRISPRGVDFDSSGNPVVAGEFWDTSGGRPCDRCGFVAKLDANTGADLWLREPDAFSSCGADGSGRFYRVTVASDDTLYLNGLTNAVQFPGSDGLVARYSADGSQQLWSYCDSSGADTTNYFTNLLIVSDGGIINYGSIGDATSPPAANGGPSAYDLIVNKFDSAGNVIWTRQVGATRADSSDAELRAGSIAEDSQGILYITGATDGELTSSANAGGFDAFVIRLGPDGQVQ